MGEKATIKISRELASQLKKLMDAGDTYESVIRRLLEHYRSGRGERAGAEGGVGND